MATDEIEYNAYYHTLQVLWLFHVARMKTQGKEFLVNVWVVIELNAILQNKFRRKYEQALSRCWMICVPCSRALRGLNITEEFVGM